MKGATSVLLDVKGLMQINPSEFSQNEETLNNFGRDLKHTLNNFLNASRSLSERLQSSGSMDASFKVRQERINKRKDAQEVLDAVNHFKKALGADLFSNFVSSTQASSEMPPDPLTTSQRRTAEYVATSPSPAAAHIATYCTQQPAHDQEEQATSLFRSTNDCVKPPTAVSACFTGNPSLEAISHEAGTNKNVQSNSFSPDLATKNINSGFRNMSLLSNELSATNKNAHSNPISSSVHRQNVNPNQYQHVPFSNNFVANKDVVGKLPSNNVYQHANNDTNRGVSFSNQVVGNDVAHNAPQSCAMRTSLTHVPNFLSMLNNEHEPRAPIYHNYNYSSNSINVPSFIPSSTSHIHSSFFPPPIHAQHQHRANGAHPHALNPLSRDLVVKELLAKSIEPFDGTSYNF